MHELWLKVRSCPKDKLRNFLRHYPKYFESREANSVNSGAAYFASCKAAADWPNPAQELREEVRHTLEDAPAQGALVRVPGLHGTLGISYEQLVERVRGAWRRTNPSREDKLIFFLRHSRFVVHNSLSSAPPKLYLLAGGSVAEDPQTVAPPIGCFPTGLLPPVNEQSKKNEQSGERHLKRKRSSEPSGRETLRGRVER